MVLNDKVCITFDVEVLVNCFTCTIYNTETHELRTFEVSERKNEISDLISFFTNPTGYYFVGYNNIHYDNPIINYCIEFFHSNDYSSEEITKSIYGLSQTIVSKEDNALSWVKWKYANYFEYIDLLTMYFSKALRVSLKEIQITMMYRNVQEMNHDWDKPIESSFIDDLIAYNINDVLSTAELLKVSENDLKLRLNISKQYGIDVLSKDGMKIGISILEEMYCKYSNIHKSKLKEMGSPRPFINVNECILPFIKFNDEKLSNMLEGLKKTTITSTKGVLNIEVIYDNLKYTIATGGLHSTNKPEVITPKENELLIDADVGSYYPSMIIKHNFVPEHLGDQFLKVYTQIYHDRLKAKHEGDKVTAETLKLSLNGSYGNLINEHSWLYDPKAAMSITINGQLMLLMLIEMLTEAGCNIVSANTDGITAIVPSSKKNEYYTICKEWETLTQMGLEYVEYEKLIFYAVNDYIAIKKGFTEKVQNALPDEIKSLEKNYIKEKGLFITKPRLGKGLKPLCISHCLLQHFAYGKSIYESIKEISDIRMFLMAEKTGKQWTVEYNNKKQQRVNRFYATKKGLNLYKWKLEEDGTKQYQNMLSASPVKILNTIASIDNIDTYNVNYGYYTSECSKLIEEIEPKQLTLF